MEAKRLSSAIFFGVATVFIIAFIVSLMFSLILKFTDLQESSVKWVMIMLSFIALFIGGFMSGGKGGSKGWLVGGATGMCYIFTVFLLQFLGYSQMFSSSQLLFHLGFLAISMFGGIIGVNLSGHKEA
ncbi:TIGR04086 family membrane protein [Metabacillus iocasae]|uniref:Membrane protein (TIGR04086 family) n=1 Tax=Priestia iocasae TaxID=2291674 RepID=A0ABS2QPM0_9BACI|nr:TIGR04086 family membrane protein [Metabacillus iocasae]MBM7701396.1 putative membrane protein (TIGR04086 family) [Metabacillus iocasae]